jgi:hypothetical protein
MSDKKMLTEEEILNPVVTPITDEQKAEMEKAATTMMTDAEIVLLADITPEQLAANYSVVSRARAKLRQKLNAKRITDAAGSGDTTELANTIPRNTTIGTAANHGPYRVKNPNRGGLRPYSVDGPKMTAQGILTSIKEQTGENFNELLAKGYAEAVETRDKTMRMHYERLLISKTMKDAAHDINMNVTQRPLEDLETESLLDVVIIKSENDKG